MTKLSAVLSNSFTYPLVK